MRRVFFGSLLIVSLIAGSSAFASVPAPSNEELQQRIAALEQENAALRAEVSHLKAGKQVTRTRPEERSAPASAMASVPLPGKAAYAYAPMAAAPFNWTGFYVGAQSGYGLTQPNATTTAVGIDGPKPSGGFWGAQIGANKQFASGWLVGVELDAAFARMEATSKGPNPADGTELLEANMKLDNLMTVRGRFGFASDRNLFYLTGGLAWSEIEIAAGSGGAAAGPAGPVRSSYTNKTVSGWTAGGGIERALWDNWTGKIEYLYVRLDPIMSEKTSIQTDVHTLKVGMNYLFH